LSSGQRQKVSLARAIVHDPPVLILDEPTANLDVRAEADLFDRFIDLTAGVTTILISHRFSTVRQADRICVVEHGQVIELGSHDELMALGGRYRTMFELQAQRFQEADEEGQVYEVLA
jgi:ABC-type multidrug transport system fused ATPase/permease subunit